MTEQIINEKLIKLIMLYTKLKKKDLKIFDYIYIKNYIINDINNDTINYHSLDGDYKIKEYYLISDERSEENDDEQNSQRELHELNNEGEDQLEILINNNIDDEMINIIKELCDKDLLYIFNKSTYDLEIILLYIIYNNSFTFNNLFLLYMLINIKLLNCNDENKNILLIIIDKLSIILKKYIFN